MNEETKYKVSMSKDTDVREPERMQITKAHDVGFVIAYSNKRVEIELDTDALLERIREWAKLGPPH